MAYTKGLLCISCAMLLTACGKFDKSDAMYTADAAVLAGTEQGAPGLEKRLRENLRVERNVIVVDGPRVNGAVALSKNSPWSVSCGEGISVDFMKGGIELVSVMVPIDDSRCAFLTRRLGEEVQAIIDGKGRPNSSN